MAVRRLSPRPSPFLPRSAPIGEICGPLVLAGAERPPCLGRGFVRNKANRPLEEVGRDAQPTKSRLCETNPIPAAPDGTGSGGRGGRGANAPNKPNSRRSKKKGKGLAEKELW